MARPGSYNTNTRTRFARVIHVHRKCALFMGYHQSVSERGMGHVFRLPSSGAFAIRFSSLNLVWLQLHEPQDNVWFHYDANRSTERVLALCHPEKGYILITKLRRWLNVIHDTMWRHTLPKVGSYLPINALLSLLNNYFQSLNRMGRLMN